MQAFAVGPARFTIKRGDITHEVVDVIVNAANSGLLGGGGVDGAIHRAGGETIREECARVRAERGNCPAGQAVITKAGRLSAKYVVHAVGPIWSGGGNGEAELLRSAYLTSLDLAAGHGAKSVAFPSISTGAYRYPIEDASRIALATCVEFVRDASRRVHSEWDIRFVAFSNGDLNAHLENAKSLFD